MIMYPKNTASIPPKHQRGAILIAVLAILITLTLLGLAGMRSTTLEERMVGNFQEKYLAFQAAETAARIGEGLLDTKDSREALVFDGSDGSYDVTPEGGSVDPFTAFDDGSTVTTVSVADQASGTAYYIEKMPVKTLAKSSLVVGFDRQAPEVQMYRVTARGYGKTGATEVVIQSTWAQ